MTTTNTEKPTLYTVSAMKYDGGDCYFAVVGVYATRDKALDVARTCFATHCERYTYNADTKEGTFDMRYRGYSVDGQEDNTADWTGNTARILVESRMETSDYAVVVAINVATLDVSVEHRIPLLSGSDNDVSPPLLDSKAPKSDTTGKVYVIASGEGPGDCCFEDVTFLGVYSSKGKAIEAATIKFHSLYGDKDPDSLEWYEDNSDMAEASGSIYSYDDGDGELYCIAMKEVTVDAEPVDEEIDVRPGGNELWLNPTIEACDVKLLKMCTACDTDKFDSNFSPVELAKEQGSVCKVCRKRQTQTLAGEKRPPAVVSAEKKPRKQAKLALLCNACHQESNDYSKNQLRRGQQRRCRPCIAASQCNKN